jgi:hypothetical protein
VVPFAPVYDTIKDIAEAYSVGMQITQEGLNDVRFRCYRGVDRTSTQTAVPTVRFSSEMNGLTEIKEVQSIDPFKTVVYSFASGDTGIIYPITGVDNRSTTDYTGFDLRAQMIFVDDIDPADYTDTPSLQVILNAKAHDVLILSDYIRAVDGKIAPLSQFTYGQDYNLGDIIEIEGSTGTIQKARVTEYIRAQDEAGERAYSGLTPMS